MCVCVWPSRIHTQPFLSFLLFPLQRRQGLRSGPLLLQTQRFFCFVFYSTFSLCRSSQILFFFSIFSILLCQSLFSFFRFYFFIFLRKGCLNKEKLSILRWTWTTISNQIKSFFFFKKLILFLVQ